MNDFLKVGLLVVKDIDSKKKFLVCQKDNFIRAMKNKIIPDLAKK